MRQVREGKFLGRWKLEAGAVVERVSGERGEARVPHQHGIQRRIGGQRRAALIARARPMRTDNLVVVDADRHRLRVAEAVRRRVATPTGVVVVQAADDVKPEQASKVGPLPLDRAAEFVSKPGLDLTGEPVGYQDTGQLGVESLTALGPEGCGKPPQNTRYEYRCDSRSHTDNHSLCKKRTCGRQPRKQDGRSAL